MITQENIPYTADEIRAMVKTIEELRKKYKQALDRAKVYHTGGSISDAHIAEVIFPELKESEDERTRKAILTGLIDCRDAPDLGWSDFGGINIDECIAWLEKQGENKPYGQRKECEDCQFNYAGECKGYCALKRNERRPTDNVESEFHEGDWVVFNNDICQIVKREEGCNKLVTVFGIEKELVNERNLSTARLWTIQDAKDGDVLVASDGSIFLFAGVDDCACKYYVALATDSCVEINKEANGGYWETSRAVYPATKEQRNLLFEKMHEAGYEWDNEKKELRKIEQKSVDNVEPKFHEGEWLCENDPNNYARFIQILEIVNVQGKERYRISRDIHNDEDIVEFGFVENYYHKFAIQDAKDGDVLVNYIEGGKCIAIFKSIIGKNNTEIYCHLIYNEFIPKLGHSNAVWQPATKEQCELLFSKMNEEGYEWNAEKKELKKIEPKTLNADKVIEWLKTKVYDDSALGMAMIDQFKKDIGL